ncbi:thiamine-phosphate kinase, partial [Cellulomonas septica]|nr:thiamine-phosphate kinase [Cellulomonas septica]
PDVEPPAPFRRIGVVRAAGGGDGPRVLVGGKVPDVAPGWDHFAG